MASYKKSERTKRQIFGAAHALFLEKGFTATSLNDIAEAAGVAKGTLYNHYPVKGDLLMEAQELSVERLARLAGEIPADLPVAERICALAAEDLRGMSQGFDRARLGEGGAEADLALASMSEMFASVGRMREEHAIRHELRGIYAGLVRDAVESGELSEGTDAELVAEIVLALYFHEIEFIILDPAYDFDAGFCRKVEAVLAGFRR